MIADSETATMTVNSTTPRSTRPEVQALQQMPHAEVLIIGAGINGIATFRDLALQGVNVTLVERGDFVSGASSASSHMIHGGIRYLENGEFRLVKESVTERNSLLKLAPHYVKPLLTTVPIFSTFSGILTAPLRFLTHRSGAPTERGAALIKAGLVLYDSFSRDGGTVPRHEFHGRTKSLKALPQLNPTLKYTASYYDASMHDPERLALDVLHDGLASGANARAANYVEAVGLGGNGVLLRDTVTDATFAMTADVIVNTTGPWTDLTNTALGQASTYMGGTKGSHIVLDNPELLAATGGREIFFEHSDGRIVLIYPIKGRVLVGTTDLEHDMSRPVRCTDEEVDYFFELVAHVFPDVPISRDEIVYRFSGVRPLPRHDDETPGFVSRDYRIEQAPVVELPGTTLLSLVGGKWTTFRALAQHLSNEILGLLGTPRLATTDGVPIGGGADYPATPDAIQIWLTTHGDEVGRERAETLLNRYGTRAEAIIDWLTVDAGADAPLTGAPGFSHREISFILGTERVVHLIDLVKRRTSLAFTGELTLALLEELSRICAVELEWSEARRVEEVAASIRELAEENGVSLVPESVIA